MPSFSSRSRRRLETCHTDLQKLFNAVIITYDCTILEGHRGEEAQNKAYDDGKSQLRYPEGKHNRRPSIAVDVAPYHKNAPHIDWQCSDNFCLFAGYVLATAKHMGIKIRWGGSWDQSMDVRQNNFDDFPHFELL